MSYSKVVARFWVTRAMSSRILPWRLVSSGGASVTPAFVEDTARTFDCRVKRTYGSTEAPTVTTSTAWISRYPMIIQSR